MRDKEKHRENNARYRERNREAIKEKQRLVRREYKRKVFNHYGNFCPCGVSDIRALQIDHIDNNGAEERKRLGGQKFSGWIFYQFLIKNEYPTGYQTLCANCNMIKQLGENF
jgi:hypothetical protein